MWYVDRRFPAREQVVLPELLERGERERPESVFAVFPDDSWTYRETAERAWTAGHALRALGVEQGDFVSSWLPNGRHALRTWFGANAIGATYAPLNPAFRGAMLEHTVNYTGAKVMVAHAALVERLAGLDLPTLETVVVVGEDAREPLTARAAGAGVRAGRAARPRGRSSTAPSSCGTSWP